MSVRNFVFGGLGLVAILLVVGWAVPKAWDGEAAKPPGPGTFPTRSVSYGQIVAEEGDSCWSISGRVTGVESWDNVRAFASLNELPLPQCPVQAGVTYLNPWQRSTVQTQGQVKTVVKNGHIWNYWKQLLVAAGIVIFLSETGLLRYARGKLRANVSWPFRRIIRPRGT